MSSQPQRWLIVQTDGASRGNPGPAGAGAVLRSPGGAVVREVSHYLGIATNNQAEYVALILALKAALDAGADAVDLRLDSELLVRQLQGTYRVRSPQLAPLYERVRELLGRFREMRIRHVPREQNAAADQLANKAIDGRTLFEGGDDDCGGDV
ncbi:MAG: ribonuclease HI family protein [Chloroflexi bacterium]|nr:ribonuclease HI family protein [Chloroflexota bacterium]